MAASTPAGSSPATPYMAPSPPSPELQSVRSSSGSIRSHISLRPTTRSSNGRLSDDNDEGVESDGWGADEPGVGQRIRVGARREVSGAGGGAWDESDDEDDAEPSSDDDGAPLALSRGNSPRQARRRRDTGPDSYLHTLTSSQRPKRWFKRLTHSSPAHASLSAPHVSANLFASSLHPSVLLSLPYYFERTGTLAGVLGLVVVAILGGAGGGLWVVLSRYVGGSTVEAITGASFGRHTRWKGNIGRAVAGSLLAIYSTGAAVIAYFAVADLLLQLSFHYSPRGIPLHDRAFVTFVLGGLLTTPLVVFPLAKRTLIRLSTFMAVLLYPVLIAIVLFKVYTLPTDLPKDVPQFVVSGKVPNFNPLHPPSVWAQFSMLPLLTLSSSPLQILAHNRSLRRRGLSGSNVKAFIGAQIGQVTVVVGICIAFGIGAGTKGIKDRLGQEIHPNLFASLPADDDLLNVARGLFILVLSTHLALCLVTARSSWGRLLRLFKLNPLRRRQATVAAPTTPTPSAGPQPASARAGGRRKPPRAWGKLARNALGGFFLWGFTAAAAYFSGVGGLRRSEKKGEEARFSKITQVLGLLGAGAGFVLPALVWIIIFMLRRPRAILPPVAAQLGRTASAWFMGPQSVLARRNRAERDLEREPLLNGSSIAPTGTRATSEVDESTRAFRASLDRHATPPVPEEGAVPASSWLTAGSGAQNDDATRILLARKERQLQKRTRSRRLYQDVLVVVGILPLGLALIVLGSIDLSHGGGW